MSFAPRHGPWPGVVAFAFVASCVCVFAPNRMSAQGPANCSTVMTRDEAPIAEHPEGLSGAPGGAATENGGPRGTRSTRSRRGRRRSSSTSQGPGRHLPDLDHRRRPLAADASLAQARDVLGRRGEARRRGAARRLLRGGPRRTAKFHNALFASPEGRSFICLIPMPFRKGARIQVTNESART